MQDEFEAWAITCAWLGLSDECMTRDETGYLGLELHAAWLAWQASREARAIQLPKPLPSGDYRMTVPFYKAADIIKALSAAGIEVKA